MASASEADIYALFYNFKQAVPLRVVMEEMVHPQPRTPVTTDNNTAHGLIMETMVPKASKAMYMRFNWLKCRRAQDQFEFLWQRDHEYQLD